MTWLHLITLALQALTGLIGLLERRQLLNAGEAKAIADGLAVTHERVEKARRARRAADAGGMPGDQHDPYRRD